MKPITTAYSSAMPLSGRVKPSVKPQHQSSDGNHPCARILVVDDDDIVRGMHECVLHIDGHETQGASDGREALQVLAVSQFDLIITDRNMPHLDGVGLIRAIRAAGIRTPVMMVSGSLADGSGLPADIAQDVVVALPKPLRIRDFLAGVASALQPTNSAEPPSDE